MSVKVLAVASAGGHFTQLLLALEDADRCMTITYATTKISFVKPGVDARVIPDFSREDLWKSIKCYREVARLIKEYKPQVIITTGAAPGLVALLAGRRAHVSTVWLDSCANYEKLSLSGRIATFFADLVLTQWQQLATGRIEYKGSVL